MIGSRRGRGGEGALRAPTRPDEIGLAARRLTRANQSPETPTDGRPSEPRQRSVGRRLDQDHDEQDGDHPTSGRSGRSRGPGLSSGNDRATSGC